MDLQFMKDCKQQINSFLLTFKYLWVMIFFSQIINLLQLMNPQPQTNQMKVDKYDRQIRLWGPRGQKALSQARVGLVKCTGAGIQALKNLVLPGIGKIDIWDQQKIGIEDLSTSFFYEQQNVGQLKAEIASKNLLQMNEDCHGQYFAKSIDQFLDDEKSIKNYHLVIFGGNMTEQQTIRASKKLWNLKVPCIFITVVGYFFYVRLQKEIHFVEMSNTISKKFYLRISDPFPELQQHAKQNCVYQSLKKLQGLQSSQHRQLFRQFSQIPEILVLISVVQRLSAQQRKNDFVNKALDELIEKADPDYRANLREAKSSRLSSFMTPDLYMIDIGLLQNKFVQECTKDSHIMLKFLWATNKIFEETKQLPQPTNLPDLNTTTQRYIKLKNIYKGKHNSDVQKIVEIIKTNFGDSEIDEALISGYINNLSNIQVVDMKPYYEEIEQPDEMSLMYFCDKTQKSIILAVRTYQQLFSADFQAVSYENVKKTADNLQAKYKIEEYNESFIKELHRGQGRSNINIYSIAGALVGQQAIKLISGCFAPMSGGYLFDGANGTGYQVKL